MMLTVFILLLHFRAATGLLAIFNWADDLADDCDKYKTCHECAGATNRFGVSCSWCVKDVTCDTGECHWIISSVFRCPEENTHSIVHHHYYNCPVPLPTQEALLYDEKTARKMYFISLVIIDPNIAERTACQRRQLPEYCIVHQYRTDCSINHHPVHSDLEDTCSAYILISAEERRVVLSFAGTTSVLQFINEAKSGLLEDRQAIGCGGEVMRYFYHAFKSFWLEEQMAAHISALHQLYPEYELWVTGLSLGGALSSLAALTIASENRWPAANIRLLTFGEPRVGNTDYAAAVNARLPYAYRVVHRNDIVPHIAPFVWVNHNSWHQYRYQVWYNNNMAHGCTYKICHQAEDPGCGNKATIDRLLEHCLADSHSCIFDHVTYFNVDARSYFNSTCPAFPF